MEELRRRAKAASELTGLELMGVARRMGVSVSTLNRKLDNERWRRYERESFVRQLADELEMPTEFFTLGYDELIARIQAQPDETTKAEGELPPGAMRV